MSSGDDPSGYLPPHELRAFIASLSVPSQTLPSPGIAGAAASPAGIAPTLPDDPLRAGLALAGPTQGLGGASLVPLPSSPEALAGGAIAHASPGIAPELVPGTPPVTLPAQPLAPELVPGTAPPQPVPTTAVPTPTAMPSLPSFDGFGALPDLGAELRVPFAPEVALAEPVASLAPMAWPIVVEPAFEVERLPLLDVALEPAVTAAQPAQPAAQPPQAAAQPATQPPELARAPTAPFDPYAVRRDFPILEERVHGKRLVWLDNAATTQKPRTVIDRLTRYYEHENSNVHRAAHALAARATDAYEGARETTRKFLNAPSPSEIVFVRGATEAINLIAQAWGRRYVERGDEIVLTHLEHHANIVPWQQLCADVGARLRVAPVDDRGDVILDEFERLMCSRTKLVSFTQVSNAIGTVTPARELIEIAHRWGATVVLDGAQAVSHMAVDVQALDCDFYVFSGHKVFAPTGIGALFGKRAVLDAMPPWQGGGNMIRDVTFERTIYQDPPWRFEAGTGNIADAAGMATALDYVMRIGLTTIDRYEHELLDYALARLATVPGLTMIGAPRNRAGVLSFVLDGQRTEDVGAALDKEGIAVRSGHHCAQPILRRFGLESTIRASLAFYNVVEDIDELVRALRNLQASA